MLKYISIGTVCFLCNIDEELTKRFSHYIDIQTKPYSNYEHLINMKVVRLNKLQFTDNDFINRQEPKYTIDGLYREIFELGIFNYTRSTAEMEIKYMITENYVLDPYDVLMDTILQFMCLALIDCNMLPIHSSIVNSGNKGVLIFGNSGSGKTTMQIALNNRGYDFFADDCGFISDDMEIYSDNRKRISYTNVTCNIMNSCFELNLKYRNNTDEKTSIYKNPSSIKKLTPRVLVFPHKSQVKNEYSITKLSQKEVLSKLLQYHVSNEYRLEEKNIYWTKFLKLSKMCAAYSFEWSEKLNKDKYLSSIDNLIGKIKDDL